MYPGPGATVCASIRTDGGACGTTTSRVTTALDGTPVVTSCVVVVVVVTGGVSSAQPINANGASANIQMRILIIIPSVYVRFWLDDLVLFKFTGSNALRCRYANRKPWRHHTARSGNFERCRSGRGRGHPTLRDFV